MAHICVCSPFVVDVRKEKQGIPKLAQNLMIKEKMGHITYPTPIVHNTDWAICVQDDINLWGITSLSLINCVVKYLINLRKEITLEKHKKMSRATSLNYGFQRVKHLPNGANHEAQCSLYTFLAVFWQGLSLPAPNGSYEHIKIEIKIMTSNNL